MNTENPDQTPTPETPPEWKEMYYAMRDQCNTARAEATEAREECDRLQRIFGDTQTEVARLTSERNHQNQQACAWAMRCGQLEKKLATLRATRDHGAAITRRCLSCGEDIPRKGSDFCKVCEPTVMNSQQKGEGYHRISDAEFAERGLGVKAPTSNPEGAAIRTEDDPRMDIMPSVREEMRELRESAELMQQVDAAWQRIGATILQPPSIEKLAYESAINDAFLELGELSMAKSVLRKLVAKVTAAHGHALRELREECGRTKELANDTFRVLHDCRKRIIKMETGFSAIKECVGESDDFSGDEITKLCDAAMQPSAQSK